jgi:hypothetical protein
LVSRVYGLFLPYLSVTSLRECVFTLMSPKGRKRILFIQLNSKRSSVFLVSSQFVSERQFKTPTSTADEHFEAGVPELVICH